MNMRTIGKLSLPILAKAGLLVAGALIYLQTFHRDFHYNDELINTSRTYYGLDVYAIFDYSVRPLFRLANLLFVALFGQNVLSLWIGSTFFALAIAYMLYVAGLRYAGLLGGFVGPFLLLFSPEFRFSGLAAMPHMQSASYAVAAMLTVLRPAEAGGAKPLAQDARSLLAFGFAALAVLAHPSQLPSMLGLAAAMTVVFGFNILRSGFRSTETVRALRHGALGAGGLLSVFAAVEIAYRYFGQGDHSSRLPPGQGWSYVGFWLGNIRAFGTSEFAHYHTPADFYIRLLIEDYAIFTIVSLFLLLFAVGWEINQLRTKKSIDGIHRDSVNHLRDCDCDLAVGFSANRTESQVRFGWIRTGSGICGHRVHRNTLEDIVTETKECYRNSNRSCSSGVVLVRLLIPAIYRNSFASLPAILVHVQIFSGKIRISIL